MRRFRLLLFSFFASVALGAIPLSAADAEGDKAPGSEKAETPAGPDYAAIVRATIEKHIRPGYGRMVKSSKNLALIMNAACRTDEGVNTPTIAKSFMDVATAWVSVQHIRFGPVTDENRYDRIAFWPDPKNLTSRQMSKVLAERDQSVTSAESLAQKSIALQGLTALERLMTMKPAEAREDASFRCQYAQAITENLVRITTAVSAAWGPKADFSQIWQTPGAENPLYRDHREAAMEVMKSLSGGLQFLYERKLQAPLADSIEKARPKRAELWRSGTTLEALDTNFESLMELYVKSGISAYVKATDADLDTTLMTSYEQALVTLKAVDKPFRKAAKDQVLRPKMDYLRFLAEDLAKRSAGNLAIALNLSLGFNALDGD